MGRTYKTGEKIEMLWDCSCCGNTKILARYKECPSCGNLRNKSDLYIYEPDNHILSQEELKLFESNKKPVNTERSYDFKPQKTVETYKPKIQETVKNNEPVIQKKVEEEVKDTENVDYFENVTNSAVKREDTSSRETTPAFQYDNKDSEIESENSFVILKNFFYRHSNEVRNIMLIMLATFLFAVATTFIVKALMPKEQILTVKSVRWERNINILVEKTFRESGWTMPYGARLLYMNREWHHDDEVIDHYETKIVTKQKYEKVGTNVWYSYETDYDTGIAEKVAHEDDVYDYVDYQTTESVPVYKKVPVYEMKYYYEIDRYVHSRDVQTSGTDHNPYWGDVDLAEKEKEGTRKEKYVIKAYNPDGELKEYELDYDEWNDINPHDEIFAKVHITGYVELLDRQHNTIRHN